MFGLTLLKFKNCQLLSTFLGSQKNTPGRITYNISWIIERCFVLQIQYWGLGGPKQIFFKWCKYLYRGGFFHFSNLQRCCKVKEKKPRKEIWSSSKSFDFKNKFQFRLRLIKTAKHYKGVTKISGLCLGMKGWTGSIDCRWQQVNLRRVAEQCGGLKRWDPFETDVD